MSPNDTRARRSSRRARPGWSTSTSAKLACATGERATDGELMGARLERGRGQRGCRASEIVRCTRPCASSTTTRCGDATASSRAVRRPLRARSGRRRPGGATAPRPSTRRAGRSCCCRRRTRSRSGDPAPRPARPRRGSRRAGGRRARRRRRLAARSRARYAMRVSVSVPAQRGQRDARSRASDQRTPCVDVERDQLVATSSRRRRARAATTAASS